MRYIPKIEMMVSASISALIHPPTMETVWHPILHQTPMSFAPTNTDSPDNEPSTVRALDMTEQNYEEQAAEAEAAVQGTQQVPPKQGQPQNEEQEDTFHIDLDSD